MDQPPLTGKQPRVSEVDTATKATGDPADDQERDVWWGAYAGRAMLPSFLLCILLTLLLTGVLVFLGVTEGPPSVAIRYPTYVFIGAMWSLQLLCWAYRITVWTYRLTTRRLFQEWSFWRSPNRAVALHEITHVAVERGAWDRWLGIGRVRVVHATATWTLQGIRRPDDVAATIQAWRQRVQQPSSK